MKNFQIIFNLAFVSTLSKKVLEHEPVFDLSNIEGVSLQCQKDYKTFAFALEKFEFWAIKSML